MKRDLKTEVNAINVDGGASANDFLMQFQADISACTVRRPQTIETTDSGFWKSREEIDGASDFTVFRPSMPEQKRRELLIGWEEAVARTKAR